MFIPVFDSAKVKNNLTEKCRRHVMIVTSYIIPT